MARRSGAPTRHAYRRRAMETIVEAKPQMIDAKPQMIDAKPQMIEAKPQMVEAKPQMVDAKPQMVDAKPRTVDAQARTVRWPPGLSPAPGRSFPRRPAPRPEAPVAGPPAWELRAAPRGAVARPRRPSEPRVPRGPLVPATQTWRAATRWIAERELPAAAEGQAMPLPLAFPASCPRTGDRHAPRSRDC